MKTRIANMIDTKTFTQLYGVQINKGNGWAYLVKDNEVYMTPDRAAAEAMRSEILNP